MPDDGNDLSNLDIIKKINAILDNSLDVGNLANLTAMQHEQPRGSFSCNTEMGMLPSVHFRIEV